MGIKTEDMVRNLPPKEVTAGVDWLGIMDSFDPKTLNERFLNECARRNPYDTCYKWDTPKIPIDRRLKSSECGIRFDREALADWAKRIETEGLTPSLYKNARAALIRGIGSKGAHEYILREYATMGPEDRKRQEEEYARYCEAWEQRYALAKEQGETEQYLYEYDYVASMHEKVLRIRKGFKDSEGRPLTQRDFAKFLEYPINKYTEAEKVDKWYSRSDEEEPPVEQELLEKLIFRCHANPYWLFDSDCEPFFGQENPWHEIVQEGDEPCIYASPDLILRWIKEGKPRETRWEEGF